MGDKSLSDRFRLDIGRVGGGQSFVRVNDTVTGQSKIQTGFDGETYELIARRLALELIVESGSYANIQKIVHADICRDGGSYNLSYYSTDGEWYEFFVPVKWGENGSVGYEMPRLYFRGINDGDLICTFSWEQAQQFVAPLQYDDSRFHELVQVVQNRGVFPLNGTH